MGEVELTFCVGGWNYVSSLSAEGVGGLVHGCDGFLADL